MRIMLGTSPVQLRRTRMRPTLQNLGPGQVFVGLDNTVSPDSGLRLDVGMIYEMPSGGGVKGAWIVADIAGTDVRVLELL